MYMNFQLENLKRNGHLGDHGIDGRIILTFSLKNMAGNKDWTTTDSG